MKGRGGIQTGFEVGGDYEKTRGGRERIEINMEQRSGVRIQGVGMIQE